MELKAETLSSIKPDCLAGAAIVAKAETVAIGKTKLSVLSTFVLAILAGLFIAMGGLFMLFVKADATLSFAASQILGGFVFSLGLICVVVAGAELFTGNALMVCAAASKKISWSALVKNWLIVLIGNLVGSLLFVYLVYVSQTAGFNSGALGNAMINTAFTKITLAPDIIIARGVVCNLLVCLAVWMGFAGRTVIDKIFTCIFPIMAFVAMGFEHCVANMFLIPMGIVTFTTRGYVGDIDPTKLDAITQALTPLGACYNISLAVIGNIIGGALLVGFAYWLAYHKKNA